MSRLSASEPTQTDSEPIADHPTFPPVTEEVVRRLDVPGPRYTSYPKVPDWTDTFASDAYRAALIRAGKDAERPLSVYVHVPFCRELCSYCGCNVVVGGSERIVDRYLDHVAVEVAMAAECLGDRRQVARLHWGGGTPTYLDGARLERLYGILARHFRLTGDAEVALEIDPAVTSIEQIETLSKLGFNRLSMGVQDFDPVVQKAVSREQTVAETAAMVEGARNLGFASVNFDLIYGLPFQTPESWARTLAEVVRLRPDRLAMFSFAYIPTMRPHQRKLDASAMPRGLDKLELFRIAFEHLVDAGYEPVGMDHFALPSDELARARRERRLWRDFQGYTTHIAADSVAFGVTGIGDLGGAFAQNVRSLTAYAESIDAGRFATERGIRLSDDDRARRTVITQLMCNFWVDLGSDGRWRSELERLRPLVDDGLLVLDRGDVSVTPLGRLFVRNIAMVFDAYLEREGTATGYSRTV